MTEEQRTRLVRSFLYVPGDREDRIAKALATGTDAVLIDLEDAVAVSTKSDARDLALAALRDRSPQGPQVWVRINAGELGRADVAALEREPAGLDGLVLAKCDDPGWLDEVGSHFRPELPLSPLIESALAVRRLDALCSHARVTQCHLGEIDLLADLAARPGADRLLEHARHELVYASAAAGILPPIAGVFAAVRDVEGLAVDSAALAREGFGGRPALHPAQVPIINTAFRPSDPEIAEARRLVAFYDEALKAGRGAVSDESGRMIDEAVVRRARRLLQGVQSDAPPSS